MRKCPYCDFNSHAVTGSIDERSYVDALLADLASEVPLAGERPLQSIFIGGGTPSLFSPSAIDRLLRGIEKLLPWSESVEISAEANPGAVEATQFAALRETGVNRLSIGIQSFHAESLKALGRIHGPQEAVRAVELAQEGGFEHINLDLMFGLPGQSEALAGEDVAIAIGLNTEQLSYYQLTLEPNTLFYREPPPLPDEEQLWSIQERGHLLLQKAGFRQYEVSAFARPGGECRHNLNYWRFGDYIGIGAGAHGKLSIKDGVVLRRWKRRHPTDYMNAAFRDSALKGEKVLSPEDLVIEFMMNALRLREGVESELFQQATGHDLEIARGMIDAARQRGLLRADRKRLCATPIGFQFLMDLLSIFEAPNNLTI
jgi:oxygen-independent coproporphyrinogen-3 oxidase